MLRLLVADGLLSPQEHRTVAALFRQQRRERPPTPPKRCGVLQLTMRLNINRVCPCTASWPRCS